MRYAIKEHRHMKALGGRRLPRSGRGLPCEDGVIKKFHVQLKITKKPYYELRHADIEKLVRHATIWGQEPLFVVFFEQEDKYALIYPIAAGAKVNQKSKRITPQENATFNMAGAKWEVKVVHKSKAKDFISKLCERE